MKTERPTAADIDYIRKTYPPETHLTVRMLLAEIDALRDENEQLRQPVPLFDSARELLAEIEAFKARVVEEPKGWKRLFAWAKVSKGC